jgi:tetratricopeptide (TPR) repeat protein
MPRRAVDAVTCLILLLCLAAVCGGCAGTAGTGCADDLDLLYVAPGDSLGIDPFLALDQATQTSRRVEAEKSGRQAAQARNPGDRLRLLARAAAAAPDDPDRWLALAGAWRAVGDHLQTAAALQGAVAAVGRLSDPAAPAEAPSSALLAARGPGYHRDAALATAVARAWHHYDRAEWTEAESWAQVALQLEPSSHTALEIRGLIQGRLGQTSRVREITDELQRLDVFNPCQRWILAVHDESLDRLSGALNHFLNLRPNPARALECYRDMATVAERLGEWSLAEEWYGQSAAASPLSGSPCFRRVPLPPFGSGTDGLPPRVLPVWLALNCHYVTGSLSAYTRYAFEQFEAASAGPGRELWAGLAVNAAGIQLRRLPGHPWALRARGLIFAATGKPELARDDLLRASEQFAAAGLGADARIEAELGRLLLTREDLSGALVRLRRAVELNPVAAAPWADLGMALAKVGDQPAALAALTRSIDLAPERPTAWYNRGLLHLNARRFEDAENDLNRAAQLAPDNGDIARLLQQVRLARKRVGDGAVKP